MAEESDGTFNELKAMVTTYAKQETVDPLKNLGKWAGLGVAGAVMMMIGGLLLGLGVLRLFQKISAFDGGWNFVPYFLLVLVLGACIGACVLAMTRTPEWMKDDA